MDFDQQELLRLNPGLDPRDIPKTWFGPRLVTHGNLHRQC
jgi:hypothetical protein